MKRPLHWGLGREDDMKERTWMERYQGAIKDLGYETLLDLPEAIKNELKKTTDLKKKVKILEKLAKEYEGR